MIRILPMAAMLIVASHAPAWGQNVQLQLPVVRQFSTDTAVVVPDRGTLFLGGISRSAEGRRTFGPVRPGTAFGVERNHSYSEVRVWIHDHRQMDAEVLAEYESSLPPLTEAGRRQLAREILRSRSATAGETRSGMDLATRSRERALSILRKR